MNAFKEADNANPPPLAVEQIVIDKRKAADHLAKSAAELKKIADEHRLETLSHLLGLIIVEAKVHANDSLVIKGEGGLS
jgi:hypothetical protein